MIRITQQQLESYLWGAPCSDGDQGFALFPENHRFQVPTQAVAVGLSNGTVMMFDLTEASEE